MKTNKLLLFISLFFSSFVVLAQESTHLVSGFIEDSDGEDVLYTSILIDEKQQHLATNEKGEFSFMLPAGEYTVIVQHINYETYIGKITVPGKENIRIILKPKAYVLQLVQISQQKEDPAYRIMRQAIAKAPYYRKQFSDYQALIYGKSIMKVVSMPKYVKKAMKLADGDINLKEGDLFVQEVVSEITYKNDSTKQVIKSTRNSFPDFLNFGDMGNFVLFNIYSDFSGFISPLSKDAFSAYNFRLISSVRDKNDFLIYKIELMPRNKNPYAYSGIIYIVDGTWHVQHFDIDVTVDYGVAKAKTNIKQNFGELTQNVWMPTTAYFMADVKVMGVEVWVSLASSIRYSSYTVNKKFVSEREKEQDKSTASKGSVLKSAAKVEKIDQKIEEIINKEELTNKDAIKLTTLVEEKSKIEKMEKEGKEYYEIKQRYFLETDSLAEERDSTYWESNRQIPLSTEETDSFEEKARQDSIKKTTVKDVVEKAMKRESKKHNIFYGVNAVGEYFNFNPVDGVKLKPGFYLAKEFKDTTRLRWDAGVGYSFGQKKFIFSTKLKYSYWPEKRAFIELGGGKESWDFNTESGIKPLGNSLSALFFKNNAKFFYDRVYVELNHQIEPFNGFNTHLSFSYEWRAPLENRSDYAFFFRKKKDYPLNIPNNQYVINDLSLLDAGRGAMLQLQLDYTPKTRYRYYRRQKMNYSSNMPTFSFLWKSGLKGFFGSDTRFDYIQFGVKQDIRPNLLRSFHYNVTAGFFPNNKKMHFSEFKHTQIYVFPLTLGDLFTTFHTQEVYKYASNEWYFSAFFKYESLYLLFKYIPGLNRTLMTENFYFSYLRTPISENYLELGYSLDRIFMFLNLGVFVGFDNFKYGGWNVKLAFNLFFLN